jgi:hypothetical protein
MPEVPVSELHGGFAFALQGWMRAQKQGSHNYINPGAGTLVTVGLAISTNFTSPEWPQLPEVGELPVATAFYPSQYPQPQTPAYTPNVGYYPFSESGVMFFENGRVNGVIRVDTAGWASYEIGVFSRRVQVPSSETGSWTSAWHYFYRVRRLTQSRLGLRVHDDLPDGSPARGERSSATSCSGNRFHEADFSWAAAVVLGAC